MVKGPDRLLEIFPSSSNAKCENTDIIVIEDKSVKINKLISRG